MKKLSLEELKNTCVHIEDRAFPYFVNSLPELLRGVAIGNAIHLAHDRGFKFIALASEGEGNLALKVTGAKEYRVLTIADFEESLPFANTKWDVREWTREQKENWQQLMFDSGYLWGDNGAVVQNLSDNFYFLRDNGRITYESKDAFYFGEHSFKQMHYSDAFPETKKYKYVPIEKSIFDLKERLENGELFFSPDNGVHCAFMTERQLVNAIANNKQVLERVEYKWNAEARAKLEAISLSEGAEVMWLVDNQPEKALEVAKIIIEANKGE